MIYDDDSKVHSHHDSDPARGQNSAFDLVRLHRFGQLDKDIPHETAITDRPSYRAMVEFANGLPEIGAARARVEFEDLGELPAAIGVASESNPVPRFTVYSASDFSGGAPLEWLVRGILPRAELAVVFGESGSGKSFFALDLCAAITRGIEWRERRTVRGGVVYVCAEGARGFKARLRAYAHAHAAELAQLPAVIADAPNLLESKDAAALTHSIVAWVKAQGQVDVVVIDTLSATTPGGNENSGEDIGLVLKHCKLITQHTGALVVLIHHSGKDSTRGARGWSGLRAAADAEIEIVRNGDYRIANVTKLKDGTDGASYSFKLKTVDLGFDSQGEAESSCIVEHVDTEPATPSRKRPLQKLPKTVYDTLATMAPSGTCALEDLVAGVLTKIPQERNSKSHVLRAIRDTLIPNGWVYMHGQDRVSLTSLVTTGEDGWLK